MFDALTVLDYIIIAFVLVWCIWAAIKGFIDEISSKFGWVSGFATALMFTKNLSQQFFIPKTGFPAWFSAFVCYVVLFIVGFYLIKLFGMMLGTITNTAHLGSVDNILGFVLGLVEAVLVVGLIETVLNSQAIIDVSHYIKESYLSSQFILPLFNSLLDWIHGLVS